MGIGMRSLKEANLPLLLKLLIQSVTALRFDSIWEVSAESAVALLIVRECARGRVKIGRKSWECIVSKGKGKSVEI